MTRHLHGVNPPATSRTNDLARRGTLLTRIGEMVDNEPAWVSTDDLRLAHLQSRVGDVAAAYLCGHTDIEGELMEAAATIEAWLEAIERGRAR